MVSINFNPTPSNAPSLKKNNVQIEKPRVDLKNETTFSVQSTITFNAKAPTPQNAQTANAPTGSVTCSADATSTRIAQIVERKKKIDERKEELNLELNGLHSENSFTYSGITREEEVFRINKLIDDLAEGVEYWKQEYLKAENEKDKKDAKENLMRCIQNKTRAMEIKAELQKLNAEYQELTLEYNKLQGYCF